MDVKIMNIKTILKNALTVIKNKSQLMTLQTAPK